MDTRRIGSLEVTLAGIGTNNFGWRIDYDSAKAVVDAALEAGVTFFDTADVYGAGSSEEFLGRALGPRRDQVVIGTKFGSPGRGDRTDWPGGGSAAWVVRACEASLQRLGTDRIDLYQFHFPDEKVPIEETLGALDQLVREGKVREIGNSNFSGEQIAAADAVARDRGWARFVSAQNHYNLLNRDAEDDVLPACAKHDLAFLPYFPLASGVLTGKYRRGQEPPEGTRLATVATDRRERLLSERNLTIAEELAAFAEARGKSLLDLAIAWLASDDRNASVIAGATKPEQVRANAAAVSWRLSPDERAEIDRITRA